MEQHTQIIEADEPAPQRPINGAAHRSAPPGPAARPEGDVSEWIKKAAAVCKEAAAGARCSINVCRTVRTRN